MRNVNDQILRTNRIICRHIANSTFETRGPISQDILKNLRDFVEAVAVKASGNSDYSYTIFQTQAKQYMATRAEMKFLRDFHKSLQKTVSHASLEEENSERLMLKYYEYLLKIKSFLKSKYNLEVLANIGEFPIKVDPALQEYYDKIAIEIEKTSIIKKERNFKDRYYITKIKPFFVNQEVYYEITFTRALDSVSKFDRITAFTKEEILPNYAVKMALQKSQIDIRGNKIPIQIIYDWDVSIRPCEIENFARIFDKDLKNKSNNKEILLLMSLLKRNNMNLVEIIQLPDTHYNAIKKIITSRSETTHFLEVLDESRNLLKSESPGNNTISYLLYKLNNKVIKLQTSESNNIKLSNLKLNWGVLPFEEMPFITSLIGHNPKIHDLFDCIDSEDREYELFVRKIKNNTEQKGMLYTPIDELNEYQDIENLIKTYNNRLYYKHKPSRDLEIYKKHIYINEYEQACNLIIKKLQELADIGIRNYKSSTEARLNESSDDIDCEHKRKILLNLFENSRVAFIYGAAGTGKTRLIEHISNLFHKHNKLYLANTNPAVNNLQNRINTANGTFKTIASFLNSREQNTKYDLLIIDECSTVSNADMRDILNKAEFKLLVLVGDIYQIESILFGNWFEIATHFIPKTAIFELTKPFRTKNVELLTLWDKVRNIENDITEHIVNNSYSEKLDESVFNYSEKDEIILCLNYDGLYGINNVNRLLQGKNKNKEVHWGVNTYKVGDPILFNESNRFKPLIHNNMKGKIVGIHVIENVQMNEGLAYLAKQIQFDIEIDKIINESDIWTYGGLELVDSVEHKNSIIRFAVNFPKNTDMDNETLEDIMPFQIAYAVSIHKAQGLEYNSVKVIITDEIEESITHNIFYTAITRSKENLKIYWTPETQKKVLDRLARKTSNKAAYLLKAKYKL